MNYLKLFFSLYGRIGRGVYWGGIAVNLLAVLTVFFIADSVVLKMGGREPLGTIRNGLLGTAAVASLISVLSLHVRRAHDHGVTGWLGVLGYVAIGAAIEGMRRTLPAAVTKISSVPDWAIASPGIALLILMLFLFGVKRGQSGVNRFGPQPDYEERNVPA